MKLDVKNCDNLKRISTGKKYRNKSKLLPQHPFRWIISGSSGSGKTNMAVYYIIKMASFDKLYIYSKHLSQPKFQMLQNFFDKIKEKTGEDILFMSNDINDVIPVDELNENCQNLVLFDDMMMEKQNSIVEYWIRSRHKNCSVMSLVQKWSNCPRVCRINTSVISLFAVPSKREVNLLYAELGMGLEKDDWIRKFKKATEKKYDFFHIVPDEKHKALIYRRNFNEIELD